MLIYAPLVFFVAAAASEDSCASELGAWNATTEEVKQLCRSVTIADFELAADAASGTARQIFEKYGVLVVRGLQRLHASRVDVAANAAFEHSLTLLERGSLTEVTNEGVSVGWVTPDQTLFIPAPKGHLRDKQAMVLGLDYYTDASMLASATDPSTLDLITEALGWQSIELFSKGQVFFKEGIPAAQSVGGVTAAMMGSTPAVDVAVGERVRAGGNPKYMHQDSAYFSFAKDGAVAALTYAVNVSGALDNGPLYVVPGSHRLGHVTHVGGGVHGSAFP